ncbi:MAG: hypothetical protein D6723_16370 [Acidobacteria bacterium]|nr:MAG: hypothetical protein D6723_16370 [Acidobacteriota bacterium]
MQQDVAVFHQANQPLRLELQPVPEPGEGEVLVRILASGVCDTDYRFSTLGIPWMQEPIILGHQIAGVVEKVGSGATAVEKGDHVIVHFVVSCGQCPLCQKGQDHLCLNWKGVGAHIPGGFAQYVVVPERNVIPYSVTQLPPEQASLIPCGLGTPYRAVKQANIQSGDVVLIQRAWVWGLATIQMCHQLGARAVVLDDDDRRLALAREQGADGTIDARSEDLREVLASHAPIGADVVIDFTGDPQWVSRAATLVRRGGRVVVVGRAGCFGEVNVDILNLMFGELVLTGACLARRDEVEELTRMAVEGQFQLAPLLTHRIQLIEINDGLAMLEQPETLGVVIVP